MSQNARFKKHLALPKITPKLRALVHQELDDRMDGNKGWPGDTLEQLILNKQSILDLEKEGFSTQNSVL